MPERPQEKRSTLRSFGCAARGVMLAMREEAHFRFHLLATVGVIVAGALLRVSAVEWSLLALCIAAVLAAELFNTALERLARAVTREENPHVRDALDTAAGAVLTAVVGAAIVGLAVLGRAAWVFVG